MERPLCRAVFVVVLLAIVCATQIGALTTAVSSHLRQTMGFSR